MGQGDVPGRVAADGVPAEEHPVGVHGEAPAGVAEAAEHDGVFVGGIAVFVLVFGGPLGRHDDVSAAGGLPLAALLPPTPRPPVDLLLGRRSRAVQGDDHRIAAIGVVFRRELQEVAATATPSAGRALRFRSNPASFRRSARAIRRGASCGPTGSPP